MASRIAVKHTEGSQDPLRPLFFVGHSLGGIVIKQVSSALGEASLAQSYHIQTVRSSSVTN